MQGHNEKDAHASERKGESDDEGLAEGEAEEESSEDDYNQVPIDQWLYGFLIKLSYSFC